MCPQLDTSEITDSTQRATRRRDFDFGGLTVQPCYQYDQ